MNDRVTSMSDQDLTSLLRCFDRISLPLERRCEGDDDELVEFMVQAELKQTVVDKALVCAAVMREALHRGLHIPKSN